MAFESQIFQVLYVFSASLLYPVIITLILLVVFSLSLIGEFLSEYSKRNRDPVNLEQCCAVVRKNIEAMEFKKAAESLQNTRQNYMVTDFAHAASKHLENNMLPSIEWLAQEFEIKMSKRLEQTRIVATISPMLGLMGTLIPLGPALIGLSQGNIEQLANNLMIAFATTVIGLFAGTIGYVLTQIRKRWYWQDMADIDYILETMEVEA
ncbi:MotA/TolQ/ExbB proton channel family protein [uncultured Methanolobus sp.]|uniref:MotA/TolQ/ExbB proton channel family protein n=1 Tax=uncultured Methanolobus sp. TaxID=218300 RepID=UPI002AAB3F04|nr:MotA/TolQ/ExbB proton channel family protein [uncultured Methanolobus sp.]